MGLFLVGMVFFGLAGLGIYVLRRGIKQNKAALSPQKLPRTS